MKQGTFITKLAMILLFAGVIAYLGAAMWRSLSDPFHTVIAYNYTLDDKAEATGWLVRQETVLPDGSGIVDLLPAEGEKLGAGQTVAVLYRDDAAMQRRQTIRTLQLELEQLEYSMRQGDDAAEASKLDTEIMGAMASIRSAAARQEYSGLDSQVLSLKSLVFRREYTRTGDADSDTASLIASVSSQLGALQSSAGQDTATITAGTSGVFSGCVDGYETVLTPNALSGLTVSALTSLTSVTPAPDENAVGKLITSSRWYFAALLPEDQAARLTVGGSVTMELIPELANEVDMRVDQISEPENGQVAVVVSSSQYLSDVTLLRKQTVDFVFSRSSGIRVPKKALHVQEDGTAGVYAIAGVSAEFRTVTVLAQGDDFYLLAPPSNTDGKRALRAGDEVIVTAENLYDGKVVR